jgi:hypothetical protein
MKQSSRHIFEGPSAQKAGLRMTGLGCCKSPSTLDVLTYLPFCVVASMKLTKSCFILACDCESRYTMCPDSYCV